MIKILTRILLVALTLLVLAEYTPGISVDGLYPAVIAAVILGLLNLIVRPILIVFTLPITILTLGLFILVINGTLFWFASSFIDGFDVANLWWAILGSLTVSVVSVIGQKATK